MRLRSPCAALLLAASAIAQSDGAAFRLTPIDGPEVRGRLQSISPSGEVTLEGADRRFAIAELTELERVGSPIPSAVTPPPGAIWLRSGNVIGCDQLTGLSERRAVRFLPAANHTPLVIPIGQLAAIRIAAGSEDDAGFARAVDSPATTRDLVFAWGRDGDDLKRYSMQVTGVSGTDLQIDTGGRTRALPLSRVYGIVFGTDNGAPPDPQPSPVVSLFGSADTPLIGALRGWDGVHCRLELPEGQELSIPCGEITRIVVDSGRIAFLSDLEPSSVEQVAALDRPKPWLRNRTPIGEGFELGGRTWRRGLCLVPRTRLHYAVGDRDWSVFEATVGIDDRSHRLAHAIIRVLADDRVVFDSAAVVHGAEPRSVSVDLAGVKRLTLETDFGENLDFGDHCVFAGARLRRDT